ALRNYFVQLEDRQEHRDHDTAHNHAEKNDQHRFDQRGERIEHRFDFFVPEVGHFFQHAVDSAGGFTRRYHPEHHGRKDFLLRERDRKIVAFLHVGADAFYAFFDDVIAGRTADDVQHFENWHTATDELREG